MIIPLGLSEKKYENCRNCLSLWELGIEIDFCEVENEEPEEDDDSVEAFRNRFLAIYIPIISDRPTTNGGEESSNTL